MVDDPTRLPPAMAPPEVDCTVHIGWYPLLSRLHRQLTSVTSDFTYAQIKEKYGTLRCYLNYGETVDDFTRSVCDALIDASTDESSKVCELCGNCGSLRTDRVLLKTLCDACRGR
ncbi:hypothetical protein GCM10009624_30850 [Gordonia sinesedis]